MTLKSSSAFDFISPPSSLHRWPDVNHAASHCSTTTHCSSFTWTNRNKTKSKRRQMWLIMSKYLLQWKDINVLLSIWTHWIFCFPLCRINTAEHPLQKDATWMPMSGPPQLRCGAGRCGCAQMITEYNSRPDVTFKWLRRLEPKAVRLIKKLQGLQVVMRFPIPPFSPRLTVTAECLTALHAVCRISAALPGFSRFLVNRRVDSAAISSSERSPSAFQPVSGCSGSHTGAVAPYMSRPCCVYTRAYTHTHMVHTRTRFTHAYVVTLAQHGMECWRWLSISDLNKEKETSFCGCQSKTYLDCEERVMHLLWRPKAAVPSSYLANLTRGKMIFDHFLCGCWILFFI